MAAIAITNPSDLTSEASIFQPHEDDYLTPKNILNDYGRQLEDGALVTVINSGCAWQYIATRMGPSIALRSNKNPDKKSGLGWFKFDEIVHEDRCPLDRMKTYTVLGRNDSDAPFNLTVEAFSASDAKAKAISAIRPRIAAYVNVDAILKGDHLIDVVTQYA